MEARILPKSEEKRWEKFLKTNLLSTLSQSPRWGHFQECIKARGKYWILVLEEDNEIIGGSLIIRHKLPKGFSWLYASRGPLINYHHEDTAEHIKAITKALKPLARSQKSIFLRIDPPLIDPVHLKKFYSTPHGFQPEYTLILDLNQPEQELLKQMKPKGRYNIKVAQRKGVTIKESKDITSFYKILKETTARDGFKPHHKGFYQKMLSSLGKHAKLYLAYYNNQPIAGLIATYFRDTATYYYGASSNEHRNTMAPYLLQWTAIKEAKKAGYQRYDFLGIAPPDDPNHPWQGISEFKRKFGGQEISYTLAQEYSFKPCHHLIYKALKYVQKLKKMLK